MKPAALPFLLAVLAAGALAADGPPHILRSAYAKWRAALPADYPQLADYRRVLLRWVAGAEGHWTSDEAHPTLGVCRMRSRHVHVCTARSLPVYAALAADGKDDHPVWTHRKLATRLNAAIAFLGATYDTQRKRKGSWGIRPGRASLRRETWIIGNMLDAVQIAGDVVSPANQKRVRDILIEVAEAERVSGRARKLSDYRHEGITWTINLLARAAFLYPEHPESKEWMDLAKHGYASSLSVKADLKDRTAVDGKAIREWVARRCPVFYPDHTLSHHGLGIHPGYMAGAAHRMVSLYDLLKRRGQAVSPVWLLHLRDVMGALKRLSLWDGRIAFPNGKDWGDYLYLVSSIRFMMVGLQMLDGDRQARLIEQGLFRHVEWLQMQRGKGDFGPSNAEYVFTVNDAKNIGFSYWLHQAHGFSQPITQDGLDQAIAGVFHSPDARFVCVRDPRRFASWGWKARRGRTTGIVLPRAQGLGDHLAQWDDGLTPDYWWTDTKGRRHVLSPKRRSRQVETFDGGFAVSERADVDGRIIDHRCMAALPDGRTVLFAASARLVRPVSRVGTTDINWRFVRNVFSDYRRTLFYEGGHKECSQVSNLETPWLNVDGVLGVVAIGRPARVTCEPFGKVDAKGIPLGGRDELGSTAGQTVRLGVRSLTQPRPYKKGQELFTACVAFVTDVDPGETKALVGHYREEKPTDTLRVYRARGLDSRNYVLVINFDDAEGGTFLAGAPDATLLTPAAAAAPRQEQGGLRVHLRPRACALFRCSR